MLTKSGKLKMDKTDHACAKASVKESGGKGHHFGFVDNRPGSEVQRKLNTIPKVSQRRIVVESVAANRPALQRKGKYTPKLEVDKVGAKGIAELECGEGEEISFTTITSCIGVIGRKGKSLIGLHLPVIDKEGKKVIDTQPGELKTLVSGLMSGCSVVYIVGETMVWERSDAKNQLDEIISASKGTVMYRFSGNYSAKIDADDADVIVLYHEGKQIWPVL